MRAIQEEEEQELVPLQDVPGHVQQSDQAHGHGTHVPVGGVDAGVQVTISEQAVYHSDGSVPPDMRAAMAELQDWVRTQPFSPHYSTSPSGAGSWKHADLILSLQQVFFSVLR